MPSNRTPDRGRHGDLLVFLSILGVGTVLVLVGHVSPQDLAGYTSSLAVLYAAWRPLTRTRTEKNREDNNDP